MIDVTQSGPSPRGCTRKRLAGAVKSAFVAARRNPRGSVALRFVNLSRTGRAWPKSSTTPCAAAEEWGDIIVAASVAARNAKKVDIRPSDEVVRLVAHGTLHLLGFDHATPKDERRMIRIQERAVTNTLRV